jgi:C-terminal processing protease CtpA/Prc
VEELAAIAAARVSAATPQHRRFRVAAELARGEVGQRVALRLRRPDGSVYEQEVVCVHGAARPIEPRPEKICEPRPGVWYVDIDRVSDEDIRASMDKLAAARGLVFDLRGYPGRLGTIVLSHLADRPLRSAHWCVPLVPRPDREQMAFSDGGWPVPPMPPRWTRNAAFVIDGRAISYAETYMGIVEAFGLGDIVGEATAGTNGNVNSFTLPGGYAIGFTGMKVRKHDGSEHHGTGIVPSVPVARTIGGIAAGRDELLEAAVELVAGRLRNE